MESQKVYFFRGGKGILAELGLFVNVGRIGGFGVV